MHPYDVLLLTGRTQSVMKSIDTSTLDRSTIYRVLTGLIVPRPIAWVSSVSMTGVPNLAAFSFFTVVSTAPPMVAFSINTSKSRGMKDTFVNIHDTKEFVVNMVDHSTVAAMDLSAEEYPPEVDEFELAGVTPAYDTLHVKAPRVAEAPAQFECRHERTVAFADYSLIVGEVLAFHLAPGLSDERLRINFDAYQWVGRLTGGKYCDRTEGYSVNVKER